MTTTILDTKQFFNTIIFQGPFIIFFINIISLWNEKIFLYFYLIFYTLNILLNEILKIIIKQPRPNGYNNNIEIKNINIYNDEIHKYGMPSLHSQSSFFSLIFLWLVTKSPILFLIEFIICILVVFQRWKNKKHTINQLLIGAIIGSLFAYFMYKIKRKFLL